MFEENVIHQYSRFTDKCPSIAERVNGTIRNLFKKTEFLEGSADWLGELPAVMKQYNKTFHHSMKMKPIDASKKVTGKIVYSNLQDRRRKRKLVSQLGQLVRTAAIKKNFY